MAYFPMFVQLKKKKCLVIGGGKIALRKIEVLKDFEADITVIAPEMIPQIRQIDKIRRIFPDGQTPSDDPDMIGLCCNSDHLRTVFYNSTVVNDTKCTVPLHGKKRHSQENVFCSTRCSCFILCLV